MTGNKLFTMLGYGEDFGLGMRCLDFKTEEMLVDEASDVIQTVEGYNNFNGKKVAETIKKIALLWASTYQQIRFSFGRESSPVLYIYFPYWKSNTERFENREALIKQSLALLASCEPDELDTNERCRGYRAWWD